jgi:hypothetical protein
VRRLDARLAEVIRIDAVWLALEPLDLRIGMETAEALTLDVFHDVWRRASRYDAARRTVVEWIMNQARRGPSTVCGSSSGKSATT